MLSAAERLGRFVLRRRGIVSRELPSELGRVHALSGPGRGALPPVVLVHGIGATATSFAPLIARLVPHVRRIGAPDLPGHGLSEAPRAALEPERLLDSMVDVLDRLETEPFVLCGSSLGGAVALRYARERPERVRALVLLSPAGAPMSDVELDEVRRIFHMPTNAHARAFMARLYHRAPPIAALFASGVRARMQGPVVRSLLAGARPEHHAPPDELARLRVPTLLVWGRSERILPASGLTYFRAHLPESARIEEPEGLGHTPHADDPRYVARRIVELAREL